MVLMKTANKYGGSQKIYYELIVPCFFLNVISKIIA